MIRLNYNNAKESVNNIFYNDKIEYIYDYIGDNLNFFRAIVPCICYNYKEDEARRAIEEIYEEIEYKEDSEKRVWQKEYIYVNKYGIDKKTGFMFNCITIWLMTDLNMDVFGAKMKLNPNVINYLLGNEKNRKKIIDAPHLFQLRSYLANYKVDNLDGLISFMMSSVIIKKQRPTYEYIIKNVEEFDEADLLGNVTNYIKQNYGNKIKDYELLVQALN